MDIKKEKKKWAKKGYEFVNRDLSWLSFNYRVLLEAYDKSLPLYERTKFLAIFSNNLEEFYRVRLSYYRGLLRELPHHHPKIKEVDPENIIYQINQIVSRQQAEFHTLLYKQILPLLEEKGIILAEDPKRLTDKQKAKVEQIFIQDIWTSIQPVLLVKKRVRPFLKTGHVYLILELYVKNIAHKLRALKGSRPQYGLIKLPTDHGIARFIELGEENGKHFILFLEDVIMANINRFFPGYYVDNWYTIKVTRDADLDYEDIEGEELIDVIENIETTRAIGSPNRFQYDSRMPNKILRFLMDTFNVKPDIIVKGGRTHNLRDFFSLPNPLSPKLELPKNIPIRLKDFEKADSIFDILDKKDYMLSFPYQTFDHVIKFLQEAAYDTNVKEIKATQYRVASNSAVVEALITAAMKGKKVTVFVELKARFDEATNLHYSRKMRRSGIDIYYGIPQVKVHSKLAMVTRFHTGEQKNKDYVFLGTGNFNEKTAKLYGDHGYFTSRSEITREISRLFSFIADFDKKVKFKHILVPNINMIETYVELIQNEINNTQKGKQGYMIIKVNGLEDPYMISKLYEASEAGVKIDLIVRGVCCLKPNQPYSKNIRVVRIVDSFLEHARVFMFNNDDNPRLYMGSADWMRRNLYKRVECVFPVYDKKLRNEIIDILKIQLKDNVKARYLDENMNHIKVKRKGEKVRSQHAIYEYLKNKSDNIT